MSGRSNLRWRSLVAFLVTWSFVVMTLTGIVLYLVPQGRVAFWTDWRLLGLGKEDWGDIHIMFGALFIVSGAVHLVFNWKPFKGYLADRVAGHLRLKREAVLSALAAALILAGAVAKVPPVSWLFDLNDAVKDRWAAAPGAEPPFGHAEQVSLAGLARREGIDLPAAVAALRRAGVTVDDPGRRVEEIAAANGLTPAELYAGIASLAARPAPPGGGMTAAGVEAAFAGRGLGRRTLAEASAELGVDPETALARLAKAGIDTEADARLKQVAEAHGLTPMDLVKIVMVDGYRPR